MERSINFDLPFSSLSLVSSQSKRDLNCLLLSRISFVRATGKIYQQFGIPIFHGEAYNRPDSTWNTCQLICLLVFDCFVEKKKKKGVGGEKKKYKIQQEQRSKGKSFSPRERNLSRQLNTTSPTRSVNFSRKNLLPSLPERK